MSYNYGVLEKPTVENFKGLVKYAVGINAFRDEIILVEDLDGEQFLMLSTVENLVKSGVLDDEGWTVTWSEEVGMCIENLHNGKMVEGLPLYED